MNKLKENLRRFANERDWMEYHSPKNLSMALSVETSELMEHFQWITEEQSRDLDSATMEKVRDEIGDVQNYLLRLADELGIDPIRAGNEKLERMRAGKKH